MIKAKLISQDATLNNFIELGTLTYVPGENLTICFRLFNRNSDLRFIPVNPAATITLSVLDVDGNELNKIASEIDPLDRSMYSVALSQSETESLSGSNIKIKLDMAGDDSEVYFAIIQNVLIRNIISGDCC